MKIYTKTGDDGTTGLLSGARVSKSALRVDAYGTIDELNAHIGLITTSELPELLSVPMQRINNLLFVAGADLAAPITENSTMKIDRIEDRHIIWLEKLIDSYDEKLPALRSFILPGGTETAGKIHVARTVCRRAERLCVKLSQSEPVSDLLLKFLNRLSDYLFTAARMANHLAGIEDVKRDKTIDLND